VYSERLMTIVQGATHQGELAAATHRGVGGSPGCGPYIVLLFRVGGEVVKEARFQTYGCPTAMACGEIVCALCEGRTLSRLQILTPADVERLVGGVPRGKEHCPALAVEALTQAQPLAASAAS
jgi:NifU-like protein involved in Fe-S cluster formation